MTNEQLRQEVLAHFPEELGDIKVLQFNDILIPTFSVLSSTTEDEIP